MVKNRGIAIIIPSRGVFVYAIFSDSPYEVEIANYIDEDEMLDIIEEQYGKDVVKAPLNCKVV
ncbi:MAG: hypothetical protein ACP5GZ_09240 [Vulcanisaeta sp.]|uniref:hypothetical protein n=1 Tax=Vulcanisaeta sp. TaxID=2020871 RepID=UPI003D13FD7B